MGCLMCVTCNLRASLKMEKDIYYRLKGLTALSAINNVNFRPENYLLLKVIKSSIKEGTIFRKKYQ